MNRQDKNKVIYRREKGKILITGSANTVKYHIWFDLIFSKAIIILQIIAIILLNNTELILRMWKLIRQIF